AATQLAEDAVLAEEIAVGIDRDGIVIVPLGHEAEARAGAVARTSSPRPGPRRRPGLLLGLRRRLQRPIPLPRGGALRAFEGLVGPLRIALTLALSRIGIHGSPPRRLAPGRCGAAALGDGDGVTAAASSSDSTGLRSLRPAHSRSRRT